jgi:hypothetical protein
MSQQLIPPKVWKYDLQFDASERRCAQSISLECIENLTVPNSKRLPAGTLFELYLRDGFILFGLVPELSHEDMEIFGELYKRAFRNKTWLTYYESEFALVRSNTRYGLSSTCLERMSMLQTYASLQVVEGKVVDSDLLRTHDIHTEMSVEEVGRKQLWGLMNGHVNRSRGSLLKQ